MRCNQISVHEWEIGISALKNEVIDLKDDHLIKITLFKAIADYEQNLWSYDGATFVKERYKTHYWEVAAFIHDWRNSMGYVGAVVDQEMFCIMQFLGYKTKHIVIRWLWCRLTFLNIIRHFLLGNLKKVQETKLFINY